MKKSDMQQPDMKQADSMVHLLGNNPLFAGIGTNDLNELLDCMHPAKKHYLKSDIIASAGDRSESMGIVLNGSVLVSRDNYSGERTILTLLKQGDLFGEMAAFTSIPVWPANVEANSESNILFLNTKAITASCGKACEKHHILIRNLLRIISEKALVLNRKVYYLTIRSMRGKLSSYILDQHTLKSGAMMFDLPFNRNELAEFLGVSRPSMSRELGRMKAEGIIDFYKATVMIKNMNALRSYTG